jgi:hypothetical protein
MAVEGTRKEERGEKKAEGDGESEQEQTEQTKKELCRECPSCVDGTRPQPRLRLGKRFRAMNPPVARGRAGPGSGVAESLARQGC